VLHGQGADRAQATSRRTDGNERLMAREVVEGGRRAGQSVESTVVRDHATASVRDDEPRTSV
jgi:hypothetical protein